ncbi:murein DD-endopeptidase MepM/ murein hydrolase activator NlpD [Clostridium tetanomorphum]|uniref:M23 family metallopeptidase n=1 Tax=Clostridium tetanomorphum TaxID=1553 RepID=UPI0004521B67|nr:M23 family metallopeptidase [Clostridium tetanomorphum]KAJ49125.1 peptidase M23 [Clostridium tetanomorphum DSM 665]KAJ53047.1 peptidase M23 [Clostridium tetanomorphum DSM 665]MBP1865568.1 murein DD-endopeptidase MepM/ murein hydrolase activator NlpD [Clostridium tetanomorphum]NRS86514.1 murein DD-endopeptidase MepM/ murein hydrolase activator NlpD [Clostridium tetanomorphum]SQC00940.1 putative peptidase [Clostridium tetanomorphum]
MIKNKFKTIFISVIVMFTFIFTILSLSNMSKLNYEVKKSKEVLQEKKIESSLKEGIIVKSDGKEVAILEKKEDIKKLLDIIKGQCIKKSGIKDRVEIKLNNKITYYKANVSKDKLKGVQHYASTIMNGHDNIWPISFTVKGNNTINNSKSTILSRGTISSHFGERWGRMHNGIDIAAPAGTPIHCVFPGKVIFSGWEDGYGNFIKIDNGDNMITIYGHCSKLLVEKDEYIKKGKKIAEVGSTGRSTGPHLHFEVRKNGIPQDPQIYLK